MEAYFLDSYSIIQGSLEVYFELVLLRGTSQKKKNNLYSYQC